MDPLTQGVVGAMLPQASAGRRQVVAAGILGGLAGMAPDLDVLIRSSSDPLLFLEYHRQFTHSLLFIPVGSLLCALLLYLPIGRRCGLSLQRTWLYCALGYATHGVLDTCTTYGTLLLWPFSDQRFAWNTISIIDPLFTLPLLALVVAAARSRRPLLARLALVWALAYLSLGLWQRNVAQELGQALAAQRGHQPLKLEAKPSFANILVWKVVYENDGVFYVDAVRSWPEPVIYPGSSIARLDPGRDLPWLDPASQQAFDIQRFSWFSNGYVAQDPQHPERIMDVRYSMLPNEIDPLWSIELQPDAGPLAHVDYLVHRDSGGGHLQRLWQMLRGEGDSVGESRPGGG
ncbi:metal-dependent hydrolase [Kineobactrum salinum]|uniref:Metal-dependent hydrolase n=1 Tax=Kineobactrum salinum TaxID=2708301 RepID=A0A6C0U5L7_9GAMM|nr:metal-dependent hydrolase [Kineobactrum salinum]QIB67266.1 metal-dependent hydrolase [Kineobactrum salinum]